MNESAKSAANRPGGATAAPDESELSYEEARAQLAAVVERLESAAPTLEESLALWERGERLAAICQAWLDQAKARIEASTQTRAEAAPPR